MKRSILLILFISCLLIVSASIVTGQEEDSWVEDGALTHAVFLPTISRPPLAPKYLSQSYYLQDLAVDLEKEDEDKLEDIIELGCTIGQEAQGENQRLYFTSIHLGQPRFETGLGYGILTFGSTNSENRFVPLDEIEDALYALMLAANACLESDNTFLRFGAGPNTFGSQVTYEHGAEWGKTINNLQARIDAGSLRNRAQIVGVVDAELGFNGPEETKAWIDGFYSEDSILYYMGTLDGCPTRLAPHLTCGTAAYPDWTLDDMVDIFDRIGARAIPQIYDRDGNNARQWSYFASVLAEESDFDFRLLGALSQAAACEQRGCNDGLDNTPQEAFLQLSFQLVEENTFPTTIEFVTDIKWQVD